MSSTLVLTEAIIDDTDLCLSRLRDSSEELFLKQSLNDSNDSDEEVVDENTLEELEIMKSFGLPIGFTSRPQRSEKRRTKKKNRSKSGANEDFYLNNDSEDINQLFEEFWTQNGEQIVDKSWNCYITSETIDSKEFEEKNSEQQLENIWTQIWEKHWVDVYSESYHKFVNNFNKKSSNKPLFEDKFEFLPKMLSNCNLNEELVDGNTSDHRSNESKKYESTQSNTNELLLTTNSLKKKSNINSVLNGGSGSDSDPPEERPTHMKREHESDSIDLSEENFDIISKEKQMSPTKYRKKTKSKYWHQRYRLFSRFDEGIKLDNESWYSVTPERIAQHIANRFSQKKYSLIIDAFCGSGGNTIQFAMISPFVRVIAIDIDERKIEFAKHNSKIYGVDDRIEFIVADYMLFAKSIISKVDAVFLSPPWGGPKYLKQKKYTLDMMTPNGVQVFQITNTFITPNIGFLLPRNIDRNELIELAGEGNSVEVEQNLVNNKVKTVTAYFGAFIHSTN